MFERFFPALRKGESSGRFVSPFEAMQGMMRDPFHFPAMAWQMEPTPNVDLKENENEILISAELPGIDPKDVELSLENGMLTIRGQKREEHEQKEGETVISREISYGSFSRSISLPGEVQADKATANYDKGVLKVTVPKAEGSKATRIAIQS